MFDKCFNVVIFAVRATDLMSRFTGILISAAFFAAGSAVSFAQTDTLLVRPDPISIESGSISVQADTVVFEKVVPPVDNVTVPADMVSEADALRSAYRFEDALALYRAAASMTTDEELHKAIEEKYSLAQNGLNMTDFCSTPTVVARQNVPLKDFMLFYPLKSGSWRQTPNILDTTTVARVPQAVYIPKDARSVYFSTTDDQGSRNIYVTRDTDTLWTAPDLLGEALFSAGNEIFPMLSADGKKLYFASDGLYGMGGYDLYFSVWDEETSSWGEPQNMGFPYSSPEDDFLYIDTEDGKYSIFASTRGCGKGTVNLYVLEYEEIPVRKSISDVAGLKALSELVPVSDPRRMDNGSAVSSSMPGSEGTNLYKQKMAEVRSLRDSIYNVEKAIDALRQKVSSSAGSADLSATMEKISALEGSLPPLRDSLKRTGEVLRKAELEFLSSGVVGKDDKADREVAGASSAYTFTKNAYGPRPRMKVAVKESPEDMTFRIAPVGRFVRDNSLPQGIVYQIRFMTRSSHAGIDDLRGLTPVYERITSSLKYTYSVGLFTRYSDALHNLNAVRRLGFKEAVVTAFRDGRQISIAEAVRLE